MCVWGCYLDFFGLFGFQRGSHQLEFAVPRRLQLFLEPLKEAGGRAGIGCLRACSA